MRLTPIVVFAALWTAPAAAAPGCFNACMGEKITSSSADDLAIKDAARECRQSCDAETRMELTAAGVYDQVEACRAAPMSLDEFRKVRGASPSYRVQSNIFMWDVTNPFPDKVLTKIEVSTQNMDLQETSFVGTGLIPPAGSATFVIPSFFEGYPAVRFTAKVKTLWACDVTAK